MVDITIYIEGGAQSEKPDVLTVDNSAVFRENFYKLFSQKLSPTEFNLKIKPFGPIEETKKMLEHIEIKGINGVVLIDLDAPKEKRDERIGWYNPSVRKKIFFMIQEMEAWILSQTDKIEVFGRNEGLTRKKADEDIKTNPLLKNKHPEDIDKPSEKLNTILRQYFDVVKIRQGKERKKGKGYSKAKDGPNLIGLLELQILMQDFDEARKLVDYINKYRIKKWKKENYFEESFCVDSVELYVLRIGRQFCRRREKNNRLFHRKCRRRNQNSSSVQQRNVGRIASPY